MLRPALEAVLAGRSLSAEEAREAMGAILGAAPAVQVAGLLMLLRYRGESPEEVAGFCRALLDRAEPLPLEGEVADTCGTGGDGAHTVNISTGSALVAAACGLKVAKHGNRGVSSRCGSADVLEALGVPVDLPPRGVAACVREAGIGFLFAPRFHSAMKAVAPVRAELRQRTVFNLLGPLVNPARPAYQLVGAFSPEAARLMARTLRSQGVRRAWVFHGNGTDELLTSGPTRVLEVTPEGIGEVEVRPDELGLSPCGTEELQGGAPEVNAARLEAALAGRDGALTGVLALNAGAVLHIAGRAPSLGEGVRQAMEALRSGRALGALEALRACARRQVGA